MGNQNSPSIHFPPKSTSFHKRILFSQTYISYSKFCEQPVFNTSYYILAHHSTGQWCAQDYIDFKIADELDDYLGEKLSKRWLGAIVKIGLNVTSRLECVRLV